MRKTVKTAIMILLLAAVLMSCSTTTETIPEEMRSSLVQGQVFEPEKQIEYVPYEVVRYVYPEEGKVIEAVSSGGMTAEEALNSAVDGNIETVDSRSDFFNSIAEYNFLDGKIYDIFASPRHVTDIRLAPGETISGEAALGDSQSWQMTTAVSNENGRTVTHIYVKPVTSGLETSMIIPTDYRTYYLRLLSYDDLYMVGVRWKYPGISTFGQSAGSFTSTGASTGISVDVSNLNWKYEVKGDNVFWRPVAVYDDGLHTYFQFDPRFETAAGAPTLYLLQKKGQNAKNAELVNYVIRGNMYITDFVLQDNQAWYLMADKNEVKITKE